MVRELPAMEVALALKEVAALASNLKIQSKKPIRSLKHILLHIHANTCILID